MGKVTRIAKSNRLNEGKKETLTNIAKNPQPRQRGEESGSVLYARKFGIGSAR
jgi:hypothetical protein